LTPLEKCGAERLLDVVKDDTERYALFLVARTSRCGAPKAIQELAGHSTLAMTMRYMHLAPIALRQAIELLNFGHLVGNADQAAS